MSKIAIVHTTPVTIDPLRDLIKNSLPDSDIVNFVDDSVLPQLKENGGKINEIEARFCQYMKFAEDVNADIILNACSSVGELVSKAQQKVSIPIVRIDNAMAEKAVDKGKTVGVVATLSTTLLPTETLLKRKAKQKNKEVTFKPYVADKAYQRLISGDQEGHDKELAKVLLSVAEESDVVVLAQASMARVMKTLPPQIQDKFLTSPQLGVEELVNKLKGNE